MKKFNFVALVVFLSLIFSSHVIAKTAIIITGLGATEPDAVASSTNITSRIKNLPATFGELKSYEFKDVIVQPVHLFHMEQYHDLLEYVNAIKSIRTERGKWIIVAGDHAENYMAGEEKDSRKTQLIRAGFDGETALKGLGYNNQFADPFVAHIKDAARASGIAL